MDQQFLIIKMSDYSKDEVLVVTSTLGEAKDALSFLRKQAESKLDVDYYIEVIRPKYGDINELFRLEEEARKIKLEKLTEIEECLPGVDMRKEFDEILGAQKQRKISKDKSCTTADTY